MKKNFKRIIMTFLAAALLVTAFAGCELFAPVASTDNLLGSWDAGGYSTWHFTERGFKNDGLPAGDGGWDYSGYILKAVEGKFNNTADSPSTTNCGYFVLRVTEHSGDSAQEGKITILRWQNKVTTDGTTTVEYCEAYPAGWDHAEEAEAQANTEDNFAFGFSTLTKIK